MRLVDMKTFVLLVRNRHFGRTAEEMNTTQPAVSARLTAIERELGARLVDRGEGRFALTPEGLEALRRFETILREADELRAELRGHRRSPDPLRIGAIDSVSSTWLPALIEALHARFSGLRIELTIDGTKPLVAGMQRGELDLIFCLHPALGEAFRSFTLCVYQMLWAGSTRLADPARVYAVSDLAQLPIITFPKGSPPYQMIAPYFHDERVLASKLTSCNSLYAIINLMIDGFGVGAVPAVTIQRELSQKLLHPISVSKHFPPMPIVATYQTVARPDLLEAVMREARQSVQEYCARVGPDLVWPGTADGALRADGAGLERA